MTQVAIRWNRERETDTRTWRPMRPLRANGRKRIIRTAVAPSASVFDNPDVVLDSPSWMQLRLTRRAARGSERQNDPRKRKI